MKRWRMLLVCCCFLPLLAIAAHADQVAIGALSFDNLIPAGPTPGINAFTLTNLTGDPAGGGFALPPDFPVLTSLTFTGNLFLDGSATGIAVATGPGATSDPALQFDTTVGFTSAQFLGTLSNTVVTLSDGTTVNLSPDISVLLADPGGLTAGTSLAFLYANTVVAPPPSVPEPASWVALVSGLVVLRFFKVSGKQS